MAKYYYIALLKGIVSDKLNSILAAFYYSTLCLIIGGVFAVLVSFGSIIKNCRKKNDENTEMS